MAVSAAQEEQIRLYAQYVGLDLQEFPELRWIAEEGLRAELPEGWQLVKEANKHYFLHAATGVTSFDHPLDEHYRRLVRELSSKKARPRALPTASIESKTGGTSQAAAKKKITARVDANAPRRSGFKIARYYFYMIVLAVALHFSLTMTLYSTFSRLLNGGNEPQAQDL